MKRSTRNIVNMHGWHIDRAIHNYIYFVYYPVYCSVFLTAGRFLVRRFLWLKGLRHAFRFVFVRYRCKVLSASDARKIITLNKDLIIGPDKSERIIPFEHANKIIFREPEFIAVMGGTIPIPVRFPCCLFPRAAEFVLFHIGQPASKRRRKSQRSNHISRCGREGKL